MSTLYICRVESLGLGRANRGKGIPCDSCHGQARRLTDELMDLPPVGSNTGIATECPWARGPLEEMKIGVVAPA